MRSRILIITLALLLALLMMPGGRAQPNPQYIVLYAHGYGSSAILTPIPQSNAQKSADLTNGLDFKLTPVLGQDLQIQGPLTFNLNLRASGPFTGTVGAQLAEVTPDGLQTLVPGARVDTVIYLNTGIVPVTLGVGPVIEYKFHAGSTILLHIGIAETSGTGKPLLLWDDASAPTSVKIPTVAPANAEIKYFGENNVGPIFEVGSNGTQAIRVNATLTDAIGVYRFSSAVLRFTAANGSSINLPMNPKNATDYSTVYATASSFGQGKWQVGLLLHDSSGNNYSFTEPFWVATFYPVSIQVFDSHGSPLRNATLSVSFDNESLGHTVTNASGYGTLFLPSTQVVGPVNVTVSWHGTQSLFLLGGASSGICLMQCGRVFVIGIRITVAGIPLPFARVTLYPTSAAWFQVQQVSTGIDGTARFRSLLVGNYTLRVEYLFVAYQTSFLVSENGMVTVPVPFPKWLIVVGIAIIVVASVILVLRKRKKNPDLS